MNEQTLKALIGAGAIRKIRVIASGEIFHIEAITQTGHLKATTNKGALKTWRTLDAAAKWIHRLGMGKAEIILETWQPGQRGMQL